MADITVTNTKITALSDPQVLAANAATETTDATAQKFVYTPSGKDGHTVILVSNAAASALTVTVAAGAGAFATGALTESIPATAGLYAIQLENGRYRTASGAIEISFTPAAGKDLVNDHALKVYVCETLPN